MRYRVGMLRALVLVAVLGLMGCGVGYRCEGPASAADAGASVDAGFITTTTCAQRCYPLCCDEPSGQCVRLSDAKCGQAASDSCVACEAAQTCARYIDTGRCAPR